MSFCKETMQRSSMNVYDALSVFLQHTGLVPQERLPGRSHFACRWDLVWNNNDLAPLTDIAFIAWLSQEAILKKALFHVPILIRLESILECMCVECVRLAALFKQPCLARVRLIPARSGCLNTTTNNTLSACACVFVLCVCACVCGYECELHLFHLPASS